MGLFGTSMKLSNANKERLSKINLNFAQSAFCFLRLKGALDDFNKIVTKNIRVNIRAYLIRLKDRHYLPGKGQFNRARKRARK